jgi:ABC-type glycerol-3-phosphate transport system permease component
MATGYGLAMYSFRGRGTIMGLIIGSFLIPGALLTIPSYLLFVQLGLYDTIWAMIIPAFFSPFAVYLAKIYAEGAVPSELLEAARIDGAGEYRIFFQISSRLMTTAGATIFLLHFVGSWNGFFGPMVLLRGDDKMARHAGPVLLASARKGLHRGPHRTGHCRLPCGDYSNGDPDDCHAAVLALRGCHGQPQIALQTFLLVP